MSRRHTWANVDEVHAHEITGIHTNSIVVHPAVEHRESLLVLLCQLWIRSGYETFIIPDAVYGIFNNDDFAGRPKLSFAWINDHCAVNSALDMKIRHRPGRAVIHKDAGCIDHFFNRHGFIRSDGTEVTRVDLHGMGIESVGRRSCVRHVDDDLIAFACFDDWCWNALVVSPCSKTGP